MPRRLRYRHSWRCAIDAQTPCEVRRMLAQMTFHHRVGSGLKSQPVVVNSPSNLAVVLLAGLMLPNTNPEAARWPREQTNFQAPQPLCDAFACVTRYRCGPPSRAQQNHALPETCRREEPTPDPQGGQTWLAVATYIQKACRARANRTTTGAVGS